ncbi:MAG: ComF family protein [Bacteroidetes bacterium]|nr:ComF family protein [Bacteroidota bacterium]
MPNILHSILTPFRDLLFVADCLHCGTPLRDGDRRVCRQCWDSLTPVRGGDHTLEVLRARFAAGGAIDGLEALCYFEKGGLLQSLAHALKYGEVTALGYELGYRLGAIVPPGSTDLIIPVPLNKRKERERGYNQSDWIGKGLSERTGIPFRTDIVRRRRYTVTQTHLNAQERKKNIADAFEVVLPQAVQHASCIIVDDIITTGSTIQELAAVLKQAGAARIVAAAAGLARLGEDG